MVTHEIADEPFWRVKLHAFDPGRTALAGRVIGLAVPRPGQRALDDLPSLGLAPCGVGGRVLVELFTGPGLEPWLLRGLELFLVLALFGAVGGLVLFVGGFATLVFALANCSPRRGATWQRERAARWRVRRCRTPELGELKPPGVDALVKRVEDLVALGGGV
jgi:hypothetical protein